MSEHFGGEMTQEDEIIYHSAIYPLIDEAEEKLKVAPFPRAVLENLVYRAISVWQE